MLPAERFEDRSAYPWQLILELADGFDLDRFGVVANDVQGNDGGSQIVHGRSRGLLSAAENCHVLVIFRCASFGPVEKTRPSSSGEAIDERVKDCLQCLSCRSWLLWLSF